MNILMLGEGSEIRQILGKMLGKTRHRLTHCALDGVAEIYPDAYDLILVDGNVCDCSQQTLLLNWLQETKRRHPQLPVAVMNCVGTQAASGNRRTPHACGVSESADGGWNMRCRLQELALNETTALMRDMCERLPLEPVVFEYSGHK